MEVICEYKYHKSFDGLAVYTCQVNSVSITRKNTEIKNFKGQHEEDKNNNEVEQVCFKDNRDNNVEIFPKGLLNSFPHLSSVSINNCGLNSICREDLLDFRNLEEFYAMNNKLKSLPSNLFLDKPKLKRISFYDNKLEFVSSQLLQPIIKNGLAIVDFEKNTKIDAGYSVYPNTVDYWLDNNVSLEQLMDLFDMQCSKPPEDETGFNNDSHKDKLNNKVAELWISARFSDFTIVVEDSREFRVHKTVLGSHSSVFAAMFENDMEESRTGKMKIVDFSSSAVEQFLGYLYTGNVPDDVNAMELFALAVKYDVPDLMKLSKKTILKNLCDDNALEVFNLGHLYSCDDMKDGALESIQRIFPKELPEKLRNDPEGIKELVDAARNCDEIKRAAKDVLDAASRDYQVKINQTQDSFEKLWKSVIENV